MARSKYVRDETKIQKLMASGRGTGNRAEYTPWLYVHEVPSIGRSHRVPGAASKRVHHLLSDIEYSVFLVLDRELSVVDIREQVPLDRATTIRLADALGFRRPRAPGSGTDYVMSTDFVATVQGQGFQHHFALSVKPSTKVGNKRVQELHAIEQAYWEERGIKFAVVTEVDVSKRLKASLQWLRPMSILDAIDEPYAGFINQAVHSLIVSIRGAFTSRVPLARHCLQLDAIAGCAPGEHLKVARHLISIRALQTDLNREKLWNTPLNEFGVHPAASTNI
ncbi:Tn7 transposase TnsA N-terminal domain-containing protein [Janthinobacterium sp. FW305-128]|nr:Tn7 transposase TnsA N-terminal domain-containing protein [Janthinobacterium sp. FW305-128]